MELVMLTEPAQTNVLWISFTQSLEDRLAMWDQFATSTPGNAIFINVTPDPGSLSLSRQKSRTPTTDTVEPAVKQVTPPSNLTALGVRLTDCLAEWDAEEADSQTVVCVESLSALVQYTSRPQALEFLRTLTTQLSSVNAITHCHIDPTAHKPETLTRIKDLCDVICTYDGREWHIQYSVS